jgi:hypothetical protein
MLVVPDVNAPFSPLPTDSMLAPYAACRATFDALLDALPALFAEDKLVRSARVSCVTARVSGSCVNGCRDRRSCRRDEGRRWQGAPVRVGCVDVHPLASPHNALTCVVRSGGDRQRRAAAARRQLGLRHEQRGRALFAAQVRRRRLLSGARRRVVMCGDRASYCIKTAGVELAAARARLDLFVLAPDFVDCATLSVPVRLSVRARVCACDVHLLCDRVCACAWHSLASCTTTRRSP